MAKIKMTTDRDIKERILNAISIFFPVNVLRLLFFFLRPRQLTRWRHWKKSQSDEQLLCLLSIAQHSKIEITQPSTGLWYLKPGQSTWFRINLNKLMWEIYFLKTQYNFSTFRLCIILKNSPWKFFSQLILWTSTEKSDFFCKKQNFIRTYLFQS